MRNRVKRLEDKAEVNKEAKKLFYINKDKNSYSIPTELIILLGDNPEDYPKEGEDRVVKSSSSIVDKVLNINPERGIKLIIYNIVDNGETKD